MNTTHTDHCIDICNSLLRGEISAVETYTQAIEKFRHAPESSLLEDLRREHVSSANRLREHVRDMGGTPSNDSGAWGTWAQTIEGAAKLMGHGPALKALQEGEEHGEKEYRDALEDPEVMPAMKDTIRNELLPRQQRHISVLQGLKKAQ